MNDVIPFGKYRGQEIEQIKQRDPAYLQWLVQQPWFSEKFAPVYQVVINNFAPPSEDTPAHNALQVRFLDFEFQCAFWWASGADDDIDWKDLFKRFDHNFDACELRKAPKPCRSRNYDHFLRHHKQVVRRKWEFWRYRNQKPVKQRTFWPATFEGISDVKFSMQARVGFKTNSKLDMENNYQVYVEIKPSVGDDYPAVLRQIKRQQMRLESNFGVLWFLLVDQFASQVVTLDQVRKIFERDYIRIVLMQDVRERLIKREDTA